ncbi:hypothetical protein HS088_TW07G00367 [Tripterygium wilfordii]|uniref:C2H2-type domain-containing protein n=1 Tax=Tripterygium wilfordii TaxID=458696 RepID=A0A7J7DET7_TRIWF|nr:protein SENSITIVE TO PROTON RHIZOTOXICITY 2-like [Tripterygium wilfordii]KAF5744788.1 hypothetical protein HS088_TW07G00367 [Tripterygium wilfordii]
MIPPTGSSTFCFPNNGSHAMSSHMYPSGADDAVSFPMEATTSSPENHSISSLIYSISLLKDKVNQVQSLVSILVSPNHQIQSESTSIAIASNMGPLIQEIVVTASSMMFTCQQMSISPDSAQVKASQSSLSHQPNYGANEGIDCFDYENYSNDFNTTTNSVNKGVQFGHENITKLPVPSQELNQESETMEISDIIELNAADLLAKYTHYCHVCGKGFRRDANLRMHMRAHGDEYKTSAALSNPLKKNIIDDSKECSTKLPKKYSCPHEGCRWNVKHTKFQPLKSMICVKNHYKRSHCPKMYVCKRCNRKQFSVLSDLRTHEKHCGDLKWQCSCGTTFSRKDKLIGHVALFVGHTPAVSLTKATAKKP